MLGLALQTGHALAAAWGNSASVSLGAEYDSNPGMQSGGGEGAWFGTVLPRYSVWWLDQRDTVQLELAAHLERTTRSNIADRNDPAATLSWRRLNPQGSFGLSGTYEEAATRVVELEESGIRSIDGTRTSSLVAADWQQYIHENLRFDLASSYRMVEYDRSALHDYSEQKGMLALVRVVSPRTSTSLRASATNYEPKRGGPSAQSYVGSAGWSHILGERLSLVLEGGVSLVDAASSRAGWQGNASIDYRGERSSFSIRAGRDVTTSGAGGFAEADQVRTSFEYSLSEKTVLSTDLSWREMHRYGAPSTTLYRAGAGIRSQLSPAWVARLSYEFRHYDADQAKAASGSLVALGLKYSYSSF